MSWTLCIDFGTAFSKAAVAPSDSWSHFEPGLVRPLMLGGEDEGANTFLLPSAVFVDDGRILFGPAAIARAAALADKKRAALKSFKTLLGVSDLDRALNTGLPASIDPHRQFSMGDLITLYLAYLGASIDRAIASDPVLERFAALNRRYAAPAWRSGDSTGLHAVVMGVFGQAEAVQDLIGRSILAAGGVPIETARAALAKARASDRVAEMGLIFEATAAAAYTSVGLEVEAPALIIADMGAGTTDIAVLARVGARIEELAEARLTLKQAGDYIDSVIANLILAANPRVKSLAERTALWGAAMRGMR
ncbi:MAG: rod shape-determining protein, partial [Proteobacteria bacterium]|nr:rod shape-determining protein [Pseudomonadota bacterium]